MKNRNTRICCCLLMHLLLAIHASGQLTARNADGKMPTRYTNTHALRDTIFVFNQKPELKMGLQLQLSGLNTFKWYSFNYSTLEFEAFDEVPDAETTQQNDLVQGGYRVTVTPQGATAPRDTFVAWLYLNPEFNFSLYKDDGGEVMYNFKMCEFTDFVLRPNTVQSSFTYYDPRRLQAFTLDNQITYTMRAGSGSDVVRLLNVQGDRQYLRENDPPWEDTQYFFRATDMFGITKEDEVMYRTIIPHVTLQSPVLPKLDPESAPVPVKFICEPHNVTDYLWRFGDGDSLRFDPEYPPPDTVMHTYYTPKSLGYDVVLTVTSAARCTYTAEPVKITVSPPTLEVFNVFTPNNDGMNDYFKPTAVSLRQFEIWIYTRTGKRVYYHKGDDLRGWQGWDGRIENTGRYASEGVYFYVIKAMGWDEPPTRNPRAGPYNGSFHLYR